MIVLQGRINYYENLVEQNPKKKPVPEIVSGHDLAQPIKKGKQEEILATVNLTGIKTVSAYLWDPTDYYNTTIYNAKDNDLTNLKIAKMANYYSAEDGAVVASIELLSSSVCLRANTESGALSGLNPLDETKNKIMIAEDEYTVLQKYLPQAAQSKDAYITTGLENDFAQTMIADIPENETRTGTRYLPGSVQNADGTWTTIFDVKLNSVTSRTENQVTTYIAQVEVVDRETGKIGKVDIEYAKITGLEGMKNQIDNLLSKRNSADYNIEIVNRNNNQVISTQKVGANNIMANDNSIDGILNNLKTDAATVRVVNRKTGETIQSIDIDKGAYAFLDGQDSRPEYRDLQGKPFCIYIRDAVKDAGDEKLGQASVGIYTNVNKWQQGSTLQNTVVDGSGVDTEKSITCTINLGSDTAYKPSGSFISFKPNAGSVILLPGEHFGVGPSSAVLTNEGMNKRQMVNGTTTSQTITIDYATETMPYLKAGTETITGIVLNAGTEPLYHPIFDNSSTSGGYKKIVFDPENKRLAYLQDNGLWIIKDLPGGLGMVACGDMHVINNAVSGDGKVLTLDANLKQLENETEPHMHIGESANARPDLQQADGENSFVYVYMAFKKVSNDYQFNSTLLYRGYEETDFVQITTPYTTQRGDDFKSVDPHKMEWGFSKILQKINEKTGKLETLSGDQVTIDYKKADTPVHTNPTSVQEPRVAQQQWLEATKKGDVIELSFVPKGDHITIGIYDVTGRTMIREAANENVVSGFKQDHYISIGDLAAGAYILSVNDGVNAGSYKFIK